MAQSFIFRLLYYILPVICVFAQSDARTPGGSKGTHAQCTLRVHPQASARLGRVARGQVRRVGRTALAPARVVNVRALCREGARQSLFKRLFCCVITLHRYLLCDNTICTQL